MKKEKVAVMYGGISAEHEISVITALQSMQAIDSQKYEVIPVYLALNGKWYTGDELFSKDFYRRASQPFTSLQEITLLPDPSREGFTAIQSQKTIPVDVCLLAFHGQYGEDGCVQGLLELADLPYTGCGVLSSSVAMNKFHSKSIVMAHGIPTLPSVLVCKSEVIENLSKTKEKILKTLPYPLFVKPNHLGSSIGIAKATNGEELYTALATVFQYDDQALVEPCIESLLEINVAIMDGSPPTVSSVEIPIAIEGALSYEDKYLRGGGKATGGQTSGMAGLSRIIDPTDLDPSIKKSVINDALRSFQLLDCSGVCRFDFMFDTKQFKTYFNEVNPIPGSFSYYLWDKGDKKVLFTELIERLLQNAKKKKAMQRSLNRNFGFHALLRS